MANEIAETDRVVASEMIRLRINERDSKAIFGSPSVQKVHAWISPHRVSGAASLTFSQGNTLRIKPQRQDALKLAAKRDALN
jgi:hypothetical protein